MMPENSGLRKALAVVATANLLYFGIEFGAAIYASSLSLAADSADFLEDAAVNLLVLVALGWSLLWRTRVAMFVVAVMLLPSILFLGLLVSKLLSPALPEPNIMSIAALGALVVNLGCAALLARFRSSGLSLVRAAFLSARNDALANIATVAVAVVTALHPSIYPDVVVGLGIAWMNLDAAREVMNAVHAEKQVGE